jgi:Carboxypeptidase regulatory-like domain
MTRRFLLVALSLVSAGAVAAAAPTTQLSIHVLTPGGKPLDRASVIVKFVSSNIKIKKTRTTWETKTDQEGFSRIPSIPQGRIQIQIIAEGYQTFGQLFDIAETEKTIEIKLNPPQAQYSAHDE